LRSAAGPRRNAGGEVAGNRLRDHLCGLWNWAIGEGYADVTPFVRIGGGRSAIKKSLHTAHAMLSMFTVGPKWNCITVPGQLARWSRAA
jgi:hypothetical protein